MTLLEQCPELKALFDTSRATTPAGETIPVHSNISLVHAEAIYRVVLQEKPKFAIEIGMAFGTSSLAILTAMRDAGGGHLVSIDPNQSKGWRRCGRAAVERAGFGECHRLIEETDFRALPRLLEEGFEPQFAYIDGFHTFDYTTLDWWYIDKMMKPGGIIGFNDCGWPAVDKSIRCLLTHRRYEEIDAGLAFRPVKRTRRTELRRWLSGRRAEAFYRHDEDRFFRKTEAFEPRYDFFAEF